VQLQAGAKLSLSPTAFIFLWGPSGFLSNVHGKAMKLPHLHRSSRSRT